VRGFPTAFHVGPLTFHTYGIGLAIAAWVAFTYGERRLRGAGLATTSYVAFAWWLIISGLVGARFISVVTNWSYYSGHPGAIIAVWQGGLASFGGIGLSLPVAITLIKRWWPTQRLLTFTDAFVPALVAGWSVGRFLGPQFMVAGGGHLTHQWFGIAYQGQPGERVPVPLIQGLEDGLLWLVLLFVSRRTQRTGFVTGMAMLVWGLVRAIDERLLLGQMGHTGSLGVQIAGIVLALAGLLVILRTFDSTRDQSTAPRAA
jgi:prolipoprotein diacylglyceryltransferase